MKTVLKLLLLVVTFPFKIPSLCRRFSAWIHEQLEDFAENLPDHLSDMNEGYGGGKNLTDEQKLEKLIRSFVRRDLIVFGKRCQYTGRSMLGLADYLHSRKRNAEAETWYLRAIKTMERDETLDQADKKMLAARRTVAAFMLSYYRHDAAENHLSKVLACAKDRTDKEIADDLNMMGEIKLKLDKPAEAIDCFTRELHIRDSLVPGISDNFDLRLMDLAKLHASVGNEAEAARLNEKAHLLIEISISNSALGDEHYALAKPLGRLAEIYGKEGNARKAEFLRDWESIVRLSNRAKSVEYFGLPRDLETLADLYEKRNIHADRTLAFHARLRAKRIREKRLNRN